MRRCRLVTMVALFALVGVTTLADVAAADYPSRVHLTAVMAGRPADGANILIAVACDGSFGRRTFSFTTSGDQDLNTEGSRRCEVQAPSASGVAPQLRCVSTGDAVCSSDAVVTFDGNQYDVNFTVSYAFPVQPTPTPSVALPPAVPPEQNPVPTTNTASGSSPAGQGNGAGRSPGAAAGGVGGVGGVGDQSGSGPSVPGQAGDVTGNGAGNGTVQTPAGVAGRESGATAEPSTGGSADDLRASSSSGSESNRGSSWPITVGAIAAIIAAVAITGTWLARRRSASSETLDAEKETSAVEAVSGTDTLSRSGSTPVHD